MKRKSLFFLFCFFLLISLLLSSSQKVKRAKDLDVRFRKWLEEEVAYIITPKEKEVFLQLETDRERDLFTEAFWKHRDPDPLTPQNEFKEEHYRRIIYANRWFGRDSPGPGWRTAMGRIYIILGEPTSIDKFESLTEVFPTIIWFYEGMAEYGLPNSFSVVFFKKSGIGEYELYSPIKYGPQHLLVNYMGDPKDYADAYNQLLEIEPEVAGISLSLIHGETSALVPTPSIASEVLLSAKIPSAPYEKVKDEYAEKLLLYKDIVEVDYTANYIENDFLLEIIRDDSGIFFIHYLIEPKRLSIEQYEKKFRTILEVNGKVSDLDGNMVYQFEQTIPVELGQEQMDLIKSKLFSFQDVFPLIEGSYKFNALLKNTVFKEFTSIEQDIVIPKSSELQMSSLILANRIQKDPKDKGNTKAFLVDDIQFVPSPRNDFSLEDTLHLIFQISALDEELRRNGFLEYSISKQNLQDKEKVLSYAKSIKEYADQTNFYEKFPLKDLPAAHYKIRVALLNKDKEEVLARENNFYISPFASIPRPWILSLPKPPPGNPVFLNILGKQFLNRKNLPEARALLERAYQKNPDSLEFALDLCRALFSAKDYTAVKKIALPFYQSQGKNEFLGLLGQSCQALREYEEAVSYYKAYLSHFGTNINILNSIGECYYRLGNVEEALIAWEKSLELNPRQEKLKKIVDSLKEKK